MVDFKTHLAEIQRTKEEITGTKSPQRKYELNRHLKKLKKEYMTAKNFYKESRKETKCAF